MVENVVHIYICVDQANFVDCSRTNAGAVFFSTVFGLRMLQASIWPPQKYCFIFELYSDGLGDGEWHKKCVYVKWNFINVKMSVCIKLTYFTLNFCFTV